MNNKTKNDFIIFFIRLSLILICLLGIAICALWYPFQVSLTAIGVPSGERVDPTNAQLTEYWIQLVFYWLASAPCFILLLIGWFISNDVRNEQVFSKSNSMRLKRSAYILFVDSLVFLMAQLVFTLLQWNPFAPILSTVGAIGLILSFVLYLSARYVKQAANIKEENEGYI